MPIAQTTTLNRQWLVKMAIFFTALLGFGVWGLYDAAVKYPGMARDYADFQLWQYLTLVEQSGRIMDSGLGTENPAEEIDRLRSQGAALDQVGKAKLGWLEAVTLFGAGLATPESTQITNGRERLEALNNRWQGANAPKALAAFDIPVQWLFAAGGIGGALWMAFLFVRVRSLRYGWDPAEQRLHLPDGATLVPADIADFDKRKWDKFLIFLKIKPDHPQLGGRELKLDLLRYTPLEDWVLQMERTAFPPEPQPAAEPAEPAQATPAGS